MTPARPPVNTARLAVEDQVHRIRTAVGAASDSELAEKLGLGRSAVSRWKERGVIPAKFRYLAEHSPSRAIDWGAQFIEQERLYAHADHHYWLRAALQFLPRGYGESEDAAGRARLLDFVLTRLMSVAADSTIRNLRKRRCASEEDYQTLVMALESSHSARIQRILAEGLPTEEAKRGAIMARDRGPNYYSPLNEAQRALKVQLEKELAEAKGSLEFWRAQPPSMMTPPPGVEDLSVGRAEALEQDVAAIEQAIALLVGQ